jgi:hypothetical protein
MFKRIKTSEEYHDSHITQVVWLPPSDLELTIDGGRSLCLAD